MNKQNESAPVQDEREAFKRALHSQKVFKLSSATIDAAEWAWFARPAQTEQPFNVPDGWKLVPVEPTPEMSAQTAYNGTHYSDPFDFEDFKKDYAAMLAAAPAVPTVKAEPVQCTNEDSWNCKYCRKTETCEALADKRNFGTPDPSLPAVGSAVEDVEVVGWVDPENIERMNRRELCGFMIEEKEDSRRSCAVMTVAQHQRIVAALSAVTAERDRLREENETLESQERYREQERLAAIEEADQLRSELEMLRDNNRKAAISDDALSAKG